MPKSSLSFSLIFGLLLAAAPAAHAQADFRPGYVVRTAAADTLRGLVDFRGARRNNLVCRFRSTPTAESQTFGPAALQAYGFANGDRYRTALVRLPDSLGKADNRRMQVPASRQFPLAPRRLFLHVLADGPAALLARRGDEDATFYYLQKSPASPRPALALPFRRETVVLDGQRFTRNVNDFRDTLAVALADCPALLPDAAKTPFQESALLALINRYNQCRQPGAAPRAVALARPRVSFGLLVGGQTGKAVFTGTDNLINGDFRAPLAPVFGLALSLHNPAISRKLSFRLEAHYGQQRYEAEYRFASSAFPAAAEQSRFRTAHVRLPLLVRYTAPRGRVRPLAELGLATGVALAIEGETRMRFINSIPFGDWKPALAEAQKQAIELGPLAGLGLQFAGLNGRAVALLARAERSSGFTQNVPYNSYVWRYNVLLCIDLTK